MDFAAINQMLTDALGPMGPMIALAALGGLLVLAAIPALLKKREDPFDKIRGKAPRQPRQNTGGNADKTNPKLRDTQSDKLQKYSAFLEPQNAEELSESRKWLQSAGYRGPNAVRTFHAVQFAAGIGLLALGSLYVVLYNSGAPEGQSMGMLGTVLWVLGPGGVGYYGPKYWVNKRVKARTDEMQNGFPDSLDMLLVCVEAGQSLDQGIIRVSKELNKSYPALSEEFAMVAHEIKAGLDKSTVLRNFGERSGVPDIASFVTVMIQSQQFGTSIAEALRLYAADMRDKRIMRAEEAANKIPTKMTLGTMMFTVPPLLIILVGPSIHDMLENFKNMGI
ncbi:pilus assembly protein TadC [Thioclava sediminum]|uniref:Type II secretion system F family protein n=2 Tax=Thioclava TaxID=285107 RepID=A0ABX6YRI6_9RHOB|nr:MULTISPECIES: type II secretion system F family protein [Thioclava]OOY15203.1 pilus assembly protein TadC [Thioclava sp. DLFJ4-1]OOY26005.1 pilus assembly protein TadC [Thioclava sediminum]QPZ89865.1 type II secretion system F family protein [Thioclava electrotropha]